jgi:hypothetical protein
VEERVIYHFQEGAIELPQTFFDRTLHILEMDDGCVVTVTRETPTPDVTLESFVDDAIAAITRRMRRFELVAKEKTTAAGVPAIAWSCRWLHPEKKLMFQKHLQVMSGGTILTLSAAALASQAASVEANLGSVAKTLKLRRTAVAP